MSKRAKVKNASSFESLFIISIKQIVIGLALVFSISEVKAQCTARALPYLETFSANSMSACTPTTGGWVGNSTPSQAGWDIPNTNYAGGSVPEIEAYGNQANGGISETLTLVSPPIKTQGLSGANLSFMHALNLTSSGASGSNAITIDVSWSPDNSAWTSLYSNTYNATASLTTVVTETRTLTVSGLSSDSIFLRFSISGVLFKVWGWEIDNVNVTSGTTAIKPLSSSSQVLAYPNPASNKLTVQCQAGSTKLMLTDVLGKTFYSAQVEESKHTIDVSGYPRGLYLLQIQDASGITTKKVTLE